MNPILRMKNIFQKTFFFEQYLIEIHVNMAEYGEENTHDTSSQDTRSIYKSQKYFYEE